MRSQSDEMALRIFISMDLIMVGGWRLAVIGWQLAVFSMTDDR
jgi:hypothetical protein